MEDKDFRQGFGCSFLESLLRDLGERPVGSARIDRSEIEARIAALEVAHGHQLPPSTSPDVHRYTATLIVAYRALVAAGVDDPLGSIERAQAEATAVMREKVRAALDQADDPLETMRQYSKERERTYFGEAFTFERPRDDEGGYHLEVTACAYVRLCAAEGVPELGPVLCAFDTAWMDAIEPARHGLVVLRPTTLARDGERCRFWFQRTPVRK